MSRLVLHSDQVEGKTQVDEALLRLLGSKQTRIAYIPSQSDLQRKYFERARAWYGQFGITELSYFDADQEYDETKLNELLTADAIHLSGGNTYCFLDALKKRGLIPKLKEFVERGGILIGVSAGSIIMSNTIAITTIDDDLGGDQNTIGLRDLSSLGVADFEFFPHLNKASEEIVRRLREYSRKVDSVIYTCGDGDGVVVDGDNVHLCGEVKTIKNGEITPT